MARPGAMVFVSGLCIVCSLTVPSRRKLGRGKGARLGTHAATPPARHYAFTDSTHLGNCKGPDLWSSIQTLRVTGGLVVPQLC